MCPGLKWTRLAAGLSPTTRHRRRHRRGNLLRQTLLNHWPPRHQAELHAVIEHRVAAAGEHDASKLLIKIIYQTLT